MNAAMDEQEVAAYLKSHPEFFEHYADLLSQVVIPNPHGGHAISITERQIGLLRERRWGVQSNRDSQCKPDAQ